VPAIFSWPVGTCLPHSGQTEPGLAVTPMLGAFMIALCERALHCLLAIEQAPAHAPVERVGRSNVVGGGFLDQLSGEASRLSPEMGIYPMCGGAP